MRAFFLVLMLPALASAQQVDVAGARTRAPREIDCVQRQLSALRDAVQLLREAQAQLGASQNDLREAAAQSIVSLEQRIGRIADALKACVPDDAVQTRVQEHTGANAAVGQENPATQVVEQGTQISTYVKVVRGERVDGHGSISATEVQRMFGRIGSRIERCYGSYVDRNALESGTAILSFTVTTSGRVRERSGRASDGRLTLSALPASRGSSNPCDDLGRGWRRSVRVHLAFRSELTSPGISPRLGS